VRETGDELYILDAPLTVRAESELIPDPAAGNPGCPQEDRAIEERKEELLRRLILPPVVQAVNTAPDYAPLRRRVLRSFRQGEWTAQRDVRVGDQLYTRTLIYGGVDFSRTPRRRVTRPEFTAKWPGLAKRMRQAHVDPPRTRGAARSGGGSARSANRLRAPRLPRPPRRVRPPRQPEACGAAVRARAAC
jgi:hypothetical protein